MLNFVAIDFEIANAKWASACQVSLVKVTNGEIADVWESLICPRTDYQDLGNIQYGKHGIPKDSYLGAKSLLELWPDMREFAGDLPLVAHNAQFDIGVLRQSLESWGVNEITQHVVCSQRMSEILFPNLEKHTLKFLAQNFDIRMTKHHDAKSDAIACANLTIKMAETAGISDTGKLLERFEFGLARKPPIRKPRNFAASRNEQAEKTWEIMQFFKISPKMQSILEKPFLEMKIACIRSIYTMEDQNMQDWVEALGGNWVNSSDWENADLTIIGNYPSRDPIQKRDDVLRLSKIRRSKNKTLTSEEFFDLIFSVIAQN